MVGILKHEYVVSSFSEIICKTNSLWKPGNLYMTLAFGQPCVFLTKVGVELVETEELGFTRFIIKEVGC